MKKLKIALATIAISGLLGTSSPAIAQDDHDKDRDKTSINAHRDDDDEDHGKWGLAGLLGLLGLLGLRKKDDDHRYTTTGTGKIRTND